MEQSIELMVGIVILILGVSLLVQAKTWNVWLHNLQHKGRYFSLVLGSINALIGGLIVSFHWIWQGLPMITTILGLLILAKGVVYLLYPSWLHLKLKLFSHHYKTFIRLSGIIFIGLAAIILCVWWREAGQHGINEFCSFFV